MAFSGRRRRRRSSSAALRTKLRRILALSLSTPFAALAAAAAAASCTEGSKTSPADDSGATDGSAPSRDATAPVRDDANVTDGGGACAPIPVEPRLFDEDGSCGRFVALPCGLPPALRGSGCNASPDLCVAACPEGDFFVCELASLTCADGGLIPDAAIYLDCTTCLGNVGRRPVELPPPKTAVGVELGGYFARVAYMEAAAVHAFTELHARLVSLGAPLRLRRAAQRASADEERHARITARLARAYGTLVEAPARGVPAELSFEDLVLENAVEGCVRETFSALLALHQAVHAGDARIAKSMRRIARDEVRHADLAWAIHRWAAPRLDDRARERVRLAQADAIRGLAALAGAWAPAVVAQAGVPDRRREQRLVRSFGLALFAIGAGTAERVCPGERAA